MLLMAAYACRICRPPAPLASPGRRCRLCRQADWPAARAGQGGVDAEAFISFRPQVAPLRSGGHRRTLDRPPAGSGHRCRHLQDHRPWNPEQPEAGPAEPTPSGGGWRTARSANTSMSGAGGRRPRMRSPLAPSWLPTAAAPSGPASSPSPSVNTAYIRPSWRSRS
jgi:hypothetical protein